MKIVAYGSTDVGRIRENNEDNYLILEIHSRKIGNISEPVSTENGVYLVVADGMGGAAAGETASLQVIESSIYCATQNGLTPFETNLASIFEAQKRCFEIVKQNPKLLGMGAVGTFVYIKDNSAYISQIGDTRLYLYRNKNLEQITEDQNFVTELVRLGIITAEQAAFHPQRNAVTQAIGAVDEIEPKHQELELQVGDILLLCSDGLTGMVSDIEIQLILGSTESIEDIPSILIDTANANGGYDNITAIVAKVVD